jgi:hypothetical protein
MKRKKRRISPVMILWDRRQQQRFIEAVERLASMIGDLEILLAAKKRRQPAKINLPNGQPVVVQVGEELPK